MIAAVLAAAGVERTDVVASSLGVPLMIEWAARHPETVDRLVLYGGWARGADIGTPELQSHVIGLVATSWGLGADVLTDIFAPDATSGTRAALSTYQREAASPATATALLGLCYRIDVTDSLRHVRAPTLVVHREQDRAAPLDQAHLIASTVPGARLQTLPGRSHLPYVGDAELLVTTIRTFLGLRIDASTPAPTLTASSGRSPPWSQRASPTARSATASASTNALPRATSSASGSASASAPAPRSPPGGSPPPTTELSPARQSSGSSSRASQVANRSTAVSNSGLRSTNSCSRSASQARVTSSSPRRFSSSSMPRSVKYISIGAGGLVRRGEGPVEQGLLLLDVTLARCRPTARTTRRG